MPTKTVIIQFQDFAQVRMVDRETTALRLTYLVQTWLDVTTTHALKKNIKGTCNVMNSGRYPEP